MKYSVIILLLLQPFFLWSQNLLVNGSFEEENLCSEYKVNCAPEGWLYTVPSFHYYIDKTEEAKQGSHYISFIAAHSNKIYHRTFVRSRLLCGLQKDNVYRLELYIKSPHPYLDSVGVYFSPDDFLFEKRPSYQVEPSVYLVDADQKPVIGMKGWQQVVINYKAKGNETFITLGNFRKGDIKGATGIEREKHFYVMVDDISLVPLDKNERLCKDWQKKKNFIYKEDERHEYLARKIYTNRKQPPKIEKPTTTFTLQIDTLIVPDVFFATNSYVLSANTTKLLDSFALKLKSMELDSISIHGHTDATGFYEANKELSLRRAFSVSAYLERYIKTHFSTVGWASDKPVASNRTEKGKQMNRRVEIYVYRKID